ncbi:hypothetical protein NDI56_11645 [Haloarcula sp. S1CR25-12]|uniref:Metal-dependent hydrolase n=1 Tax=Haloarcula saliterrae TaxID=2950534 RepID=A0ABU2FCW7_9EURY|nr:hypothetical protein [Haloarcula sp. S1CR25-12]MDS0260047.1 hypothetical protein [Haloarcula sp. S1CR25-12]
MPAARTGCRGIPIYSRDHFLLSVAVGLAAGLYAGLDLLTGLGWVAFAAAVGVGIDFDHFLVAWYNTGDPRAIRYCLRHPRAVFTDQGSIFEPYEISKLDRLLSHMLIGGPLVAALWVPAPALAVLAAVTLYVHVVADLAQDIRDLRETNGSLR